MVLLILNFGDINQKSRRKRKNSMDQLTSKFQIMKMRKEIKILHEEIRELKLMLKKQAPEWCHPESAMNFSDPYPIDKMGK